MRISNAPVTGDIMRREDTEKTVRPNLKSAIGSKFLILPALVLVAAASGPILNIFFSIPLDAVTAVAATTILIIMWLPTYFLEIRTHEYRFSSNEVEVRKGFLSFSRENIAYDRVTDISYSQPLTQRPFGTGNVKLNTAGGNYHEIQIKYIDNPEKEYRRLRNIIWDE